MQPPAVTEPAYHVRLGLASDPFAADAMPEFYFVGAQRRFLVQRAVHALYFSGATVVLLGGDGTGKTRTLAEIAGELKDLADICRIDATVLMDAAEIRVLLAATLGLPNTVAAAGNTDLVYALERMRPSDSDPQPILIAIDAAHLLSIETLAECAALIAGAGGRLRLLLAGEADLHIAWQQAQAGAAEILELKPLDRNETEDYVRTKMLAAGYREERLLSAPEFDRWHEQSGGNFGKINALAPQFLQPQPEPVSIARRVRTLPLPHIAIAAIALTVVIVLALYGGEDSPASQQISLAQPTDIAEPVPAQNADVERNTVALPLPLPLPAPQPMTGAEREATPQVPARTTSATVSATTASPATKVLPTPAEKSGVVKDNAPAKTDAPVKTAAEPAKDPGKSSTMSADEQALLAMPSSNYVLQLLGAESKTTVDKFAKGAGRGLKLYMYRTKLRGKPWFIVVTGPYADKKAAQAGLEKLPEAVRKQQPWPRTLANVQADLRAHGGR